MNRFTLRTRIFLSYLLLIIPAAILLIIFTNRQITGAIEDTFYHDFDKDTGIILEYVEETIYDDLFDPEYDLDEALQELTELADDIDVRVQLLDLDGRFTWFDTADGGQIEEKDIGSPADIVELIEFDEPSEIFDTETETLFLSFFIEFDEEREAIVRMGRSGEQMLQDRRTRSTFVVVGTVSVAVILTAGLGSLMANSLIRPLDQLRQTAQKMTKGNLETRAETAAPPEIAELAHDFNEMAKAVEMMVAEQKAFAGNAAHELRTPLTAIRLRTEVLLEDEPDAALTQQYIEEIDAEAHRLSRLVEDLRFLSQSDANRIEMGREMVDFGRIIRTVKQEYDMQITQKRLHWHSDIDPDLPTVEAGLNHMQVVMRNLIENAIKYTPEGGTIEVSARTAGKQLTIIVKDSGLGIAAEALPHLFKRFYRADKSRNRAIPGSGLGLGIAQNLLELYGGSLVVESDGMGQGTTATVSVGRINKLGDNVLPLASRVYLETRGATSVSPKF